MINDPLFLAVLALALIVAVVIMVRGQRRKD